jgi:hypothetical protein
MKVPHSCAFQHREAAEVGVRLVVEGPGDQHVEGSVASFRSRGDQIGAENCMAR